MEEETASIIDDRRSNTYVLPFGLLFAVLVLVGIFFRGVDISKDSLTLDEAQSIWQASHSIEFIVNYEARNVHLPAHVILLHFWINLFGASPGSVRFLSVIPGVLLLPAVYLLAEKIYNDKVKALYLMGVAAISPFLIWYSREIRMYAFLALFATLSYYFYLRLLEKQSILNLILYTVINIFGMYTHYFFNLALLSQVAFLGVSYLGKLQRIDRRVVVTFLVSYVVTGAVFLPWVLFFLSQNAAHIGEPRLDRPTPFNIILSVFEFTLGYQPEISTTVLISSWPILSLLGFVFLTKRNKLITPGIYLVVLGVALPTILIYAVSILYKPMFLTRYLIAVVPFYLIFISWVILEMGGNFKYVLATVFILVLLYSVYVQFRSPDLLVKEDYRDAVTYVNQNATDRDVVVVSPSYTIFPVEYYYKSQSKLTTYPFQGYNLTDLVSVPTDSLVKDIDSIRSGHARLFLVDTPNLRGGAQVQQFLDQNFQRLYYKQFSQTVWVSVYQTEY